MSEFKFACPVCGQHITSDSSASGTQLQCPTCFQKIVVPQAPASGESKFILSAAQVSKPRPTGTAPGAEGGALPRRTSKASFWATIGFFILLAGAGTTVYAFRDKIFGPSAKPASTNTTAIAKATKPTAPAKTYDVPTNASWSLDLSNSTLPETAVAGKIHGSGFSAEKVTIQGGTMQLRQGAAWPPDLGLTLGLFAQQAEELAGKTVEIAPDRQPPLPKLTLRWKDPQGQAQTRAISSGYALHISFGQPANGRLPGKVYVALPDDEKSFVAGTFQAEIRKPNPPKPKVPKQPKR